MISLRSRPISHRAITRVIPHTALGVTALLALASSSVGLGQTTYTTNTTINSAVALTEDFSVTNSATLAIISGGSLSNGANEAFVGGTEFASGTGELTLSGGGDLSNRSGYLGYTNGSSGTATVSGVGSTWTNTANFVVGRGGAGSLTVNNGGSVSSAFATLAHAASSTGSLSVSGAGSTWSTTTSSTIGRLGAASVTINNGGDVVSSTTTLGSDAGGSGEVTLSGTGSTWTNSSAITVGGSGTGTLTILGGATVSTSLGNVIGLSTGGSGSATVSGSGSSWSSAQHLIIGNEGSGTLTVAEGGEISTNHGASSIFIALEATGVGTLNIGAAADTEAAAAGKLRTATITQGAGVGTLQFNTTGTDSAPTHFTRDGTSAGTGVNTAGGLSLVHTAGHTVFTGTLAHTGATSINGGAFILNGTITGSDVTVASDAALGGEGSIQQATTLLAGAHLLPGDGVGTLTFEAGLSIAAGANIDFDLGSSSDLIRLSGGAFSKTGLGTITINLTDSGGFAADTYTLIDATGADLGSIGATSFALGTTIGGYTYSFARTGDLIQLIATASPIPEPATWTSLIGAAAFAAAITRRRRA